MQASTAHLAAMTFNRSSRANMYALARGVWLYGSKAHQSIFRVESRLAQSVSYETVRTALRNMAEAVRNDLRNIGVNEKHRWFSIVGDNVQTYSKERIHRIGRQSKMIKGFAGTAVEMLDFDPAALDLKELLERRAKMERRGLTADMILGDIDFDHLTHVATLQFLRALLTFVPALSCYQAELDTWISENLQKHQINPHRLTHIIPLATNSADEMTAQGMKEAIVDFLTVQMGINDETVDNRPMIFSGDGKTFDMVLKVMKYLSPHDGDVESLRCVVSLLELWHTKWTDLNRVVRTHWGKGHEHDPSTLAFVAAATDCPTPSDLRKVDFYAGAHLVDLALDGHILNCWECVHVVYSYPVAGADYQYHQDIVSRLQTLSNTLKT